MTLTCSDSFKSTVSSLPSPLTSISFTSSSTFDTFGALGFFRLWVPRGSLSITFGWTFAFLTKGSLVAESLESVESLLVPLFLFSAVPLLLALSGIVGDSSDARLCWSLWFRVFLLGGRPERLLVGEGLAFLFVALGGEWLWCLLVRGVFSSFPLLDFTLDFDAFFPVCFGFISGDRLVFLLETRLDAADSSLAVCDFLGLPLLAFFLNIKQRHAKNCKLDLLYHSNENYFTKSLIKKPSQGTQTRFISSNNLW